MVFAKLKTLAKRHPWLTYATYLTVIVVFGLEVALRIFVDFNPSYYMGYQELRPGAVIDYPYGTIRFNQDGFPDDEFMPAKTKPRVAYIGDSVCYGVGAGAGYRVSEVLENAFPQFEHMNMSMGVGSGIQFKPIQKILDRQEAYDIDIFVYLMNLNDILPDQTDQQPTRKLEWRQAFDWLRGRSYLYTYLRLIVKNIYVRKGFEITNQPMFELFPSEYEEVFDATCERIKHLDTELKSRGATLAVVALPYEMQISLDAEGVYRRSGILWADDFLAQGSQMAIQKRLKDVLVLDAYEAFVAPELNADRTTYAVGECFVYNRGDKLDWNHPNRKGHRLIAEFLGRHGLFDRLSREKETPSADQ